MVIKEIYSGRDETSITKLNNFIDPFYWLFSNRVLRTRFQPQRLKPLRALAPLKAD